MILDNGSDRQPPVEPLYLCSKGGWAVNQPIPNHGGPINHPGVMICSLSTRRNADSSCRVCSINELRVSVALGEVFAPVDASTLAPKKRRSGRQKRFRSALIMFHPRGDRLKLGRFHRRLPRLWGGWVLTCHRSRPAQLFPVNTPGRRYKSRCIRRGVSRRR